MKNFEINLTTMKNYYFLFFTLVFSMLVLLYTPPKEAFSFVHKAKPKEGKQIIRKIKNLNNNKVTQFLWTAFKTESFEEQMTVRFSCDKNNQMNIVLTDPGQADFVKGWQAIVRIATGNVPPSRKGYKKFIYTGTFLNNAKTLSIRKRDVKHFLKELNTLRVQALKNQETGIKEYDEKINYCNKLPQKNRQSCYHSASGYQVQNPHIIIWIVAEETKRSAGKYGVFDIKPLENLKKLSCY